MKQYHFALSVLLVSALVIPTATADNSSSDSASPTTPWVSLFGELTRAPFSRANAAPIPEIYKSDFVLTEPVLNESREPASVPAQKNLKTNVHSPLKSALSAPGKSKLPPSVDLGVEMRMRTARDAATFWVVRRGEKYNLLYSNSGGTKSSIDIASTQFNELFESARDVQSGREPQSINAAACHGSIVQLFLVNKAHPEQSKIFCVDAEHKPSAALNKLGFMLSSFVR